MRLSKNEDPGPAGLHITTESYRAHGEALERSFREHHPKAEFVGLNLDSGDPLPLDQDELPRMAAIYDPTQVVGALKPRLIREACGGRSWCCSTAISRCSAGSTARSDSGLSAVMCGVSTRRCPVRALRYRDAMTSAGEPLDTRMRLAYREALLAVERLRRRAAEPVCRRRRVQRLALGAGRRAWLEPLPARGSRGTPRPSGRI